VSIVVALRSETGHIHLASDNAITKGSFRSQLTQSKVNKIMVDDTPVVYGCVGGLLLQNVLDTFVWPPIDGLDPYKWLVVHVVPFIRERLSLAGFISDANGEFADVQFMVGVEGRLFLVECDLSVIEPDDGLYAVGSGEGLALGALLAFLLSAPGLCDDFVEVLLDKVVCLVSSRDAFCGYGVSLVSTVV
jgi:ATP-dependent protease HslVU (ClpYQ) peptidase subunit